MNGGKREEEGREGRVVLGKGRSCDGRGSMVEQYGGRGRRKECVTEKEEEEEKERYRVGKKPPPFAKENVATEEDAATNSIVLSWTVIAYL
ncbi:hypothetical protein BHM03_00039398 [Ensete ventricosum]|uniref:Uncharacterized protein n=1 Tax=Ensete ventricosum TaxID=4639 RepID=A0A445MKG7_ENSVE|nr:hypothetical protein BHM03_00039398 [Ensete ventricosum]